MLTIASDGINITGLWIEKQKYFPEIKNAASDNFCKCEVIEKAVIWLNRYFDNEKPDINELPLAPEGNEFRRSVWDILKNIPYGTCITYGDIAKEISLQTGKKMSAQAVGGAVGHNPIGIIIPCHRVIGADGSLTGYAGGLDIKRKLLIHEGYLSDKDQILK